jgi:Ca2+-binding EF-hand superfamily protein
MCNEEYLPKAFKFFDKDGNGFIDMDELMEALGDDELGPNEQVIQDIIRDIDKDKVSRLPNQNSVTEHHTEITYYELQKLSYIYLNPDIVIKFKSFQINQR